MQTIEHTMALYLAMDGDMDKVKRYLPAFLLPDAIRMYTGLREYSHFEMSPDKMDVSYMKFPSDMKSMTRESVQALLQTDSHITEHGKCAIGEDTNAYMFEKYNKHLPEDMYRGIYLHLVQDSLFDTFVREKIDCTKRYDDEFVLADGAKVDGAGVRKSIANMESFMSYALAEKCYTKYGITPNQEWFDKNIRPVIEEAYPADLAENTYKYMKFTPEASEAIKNHAWQGLKVEGVGLASYSKILSEVVDTTRNTFNSPWHYEWHYDMQKGDIPEPVATDYAETDHDREDGFV